MGRVSICQKNCNTIDLRRAQVNESMVMLVYPNCHDNWGGLIELHHDMYCALISQVNFTALDNVAIIAIFNVYINIYEKYPWTKSKL